MTSDTGYSVTIARPDIFAGQTERKPSCSNVLQMSSGRTLPVVKVQLTMGRRALTISVFVSEVRDDFNLGLDVLRAYDTSVNLELDLLRLGQEEVIMWNPRSTIRIITA
jgi:hypothetical protein